MAQTQLIDETGRTVFRGTQKPPGGGSQPVAYKKRTVANGDCAGGFQAAGFANAVAPGNVVSWIAVSVDPRGQFNAPCGSLCSVKTGEQLGTSGQLWFKTGPLDTDWIQVA